MNPNQPTDRTKLNRCPLCGEECKLDILGDTVYCASRDGGGECFYAIDANGPNQSIQLHNSIKPPCVWDYGECLGIMGKQYYQGCDRRKVFRGGANYCPNCGGEIQVKGEE